jgi:hypothetical protein
MGARRSANDLIKYHNVMIALSKARAALWLVDEIHGGNISPADPDVRDWLVGFGTSIIGDALTEAEAAFKKSQHERDAQATAWDEAWLRSRLEGLGGGDAA